MILRRSSTQQRGLTLIEVVLALGILSILLTVAYGALSSISRSKKTIDDYQDVYLVAQSLLRRVTRELQLVTCEQDGQNLNCTRGKGILPDPDKPNDKSGPIMLAVQNQSNHESTITFLAMEAGQYIPDGSSRSGMVQITYRIGKDSADDKLYTFVRDEVPYLFPVAEAYKKRLTFPITKNVVSFSFQFYDKDSDSWSDQWGVKSSTQGNLPTLIKFSLVLRSANDMDVPFETIVPVRTALQQ